MSDFDASKYLTKLKGKDYLEVKWRLVWLRTDHANALINTAMIEHEPGQSAVFKASVVIPDGGSATGWGSETKADFGDYIEKAETKAIGRALAALGYGTQFCEDHAFGTERVVDSPVQRPPTAPGRLWMPPEQQAKSAPVPAAPKPPVQPTTASADKPEEAGERDKLINTITDCAIQLGKAEDKLNATAKKHDGATDWRQAKIGFLKMYAKALADEVVAKS